MRSLTKKMHKGQKGLTLIELLIVVAILGIIAAVVIPNLGGFMITGRLSAANTELENVKTAGLAYYAEHEQWPTDAAMMAVLEEDFIAGDLRGTYLFDVDGWVSADGTGWADLAWEAGVDGHGRWIRATTP